MSKYQITQVYLGIRDEEQSLGLKTTNHLDWFDFETIEDGLMHLIRTPILDKPHVSFRIDTYGKEPIKFNDIDHMVKCRAFLNSIIYKNNSPLKDVLVFDGINFGYPILKVITKVFNDCGYRNHLSKTIFGIPFGEFEPMTYINSDRHHPVSEMSLKPKKETVSSPYLDIVAHRKKLLITHESLTEKERIELLLRYDELLQQEEENNR